MRNVQVIKLATYIHSAFDTRIFFKEAVSLLKAGYSVKIIVPHDRDEKKDGINILAIRKFEKGYLKLWITPWLILIKALKQKGKNIFHVHDSQLLLISIILKLLGRTVVYDAHEDTPLQISYQHWIPNILKPGYALYYKWIEYLSGKLFNAIIVAEPVIAKYFPADKTTLIRNFPILEKFSESKKSNYLGRDNVVVYVGLLSEVRGILEMAEGVNIANNKIDSKLILIGDFAPNELKKQVLSNNHIIYLGAQPHDKVIETLHTSKVGLIITHPVERYKTNYPVKLFEYMAAGIPVVASKFGEVGKFTMESECGITVDPMNTIEIANAIVELLKNSDEAEVMGARGKKAICDKYNWEIEAQKLVNLYIDLESKMQ